MQSLYEAVEERFNSLKWEMIKHFSSDNLVARCYTYDIDGKYALVGIVDNIEMLSIPCGNDIDTAKFSVNIDSAKIEEFLKEIRENPRIENTYMCYVEFYDKTVLVAKKFIGKALLRSGEPLRLNFSFTLSFFHESNYNSIRYSDNK